jgi:hypothetical protein
LHGPGFQKRLLQGLNLAFAGQPADGGYFPAVYLPCGGKTGVNSCSIQKYSAGPAFSNAAAFLGSFEAQVLTQDVQQGILAGYVLYFHHAAIEPEFQCHVASIRFWFAVSFGGPGPLKEYGGRAVPLYIKLLKQLVI